MKFLIFLLVVSLCGASKLKDVPERRLDQRPGPESPLGLATANGVSLNVSSLFDPTRDANTKYYIFLRSSYWRCLTCDCAYDNQSPNLFVKTAYCYPTANQLFYLVPTDGNGIYVNTDPTTGGKNGTSVRASTTYRIVNAEDQRCMDIYYGAGDSDGAVVNWVVTNDCSSADTQKWIFTDIASTSYNYYTIQNQAVSSNGYITTRGYSTSEGVLVHLWGLSDSSSPDWTQEWAYTS
ncbi:uncharacterized protein LOC110862789 [Folsomia candida]|uniref:Ricin B lectin domain-containing protein n=1 Tax=Folsomia candida TaxID=158441 RepID=A0A226CU33_FOLCA|nr:uncharacterized protein LOC110862789 [Folsomia candida]OXA36955.1 hypothetical protein Fcan01_28292 [Folsomia candida]